MEGDNQTVKRLGSSVPGPTFAAAFFAILAIAAGVWAVNSHNKIDTLQRDLTEIRASAHASVYRLEPTESAPGGLRGEVFITPTGSGAISVSGLPAAGDNEEFRIWYLYDDGSPLAGGTLAVDANGQGFALIPGDTQSHSGIAISLESADSDSADMTYLLIAEVRSGRG